MTANMYFGVIATERIGNASIVVNDKDLLSIRERWRQFGVSLEELRCYSFELSSTGSDIRIYAQRFEVASFHNQCHASLESSVSPNTVSSQAAHGDA
jgi:hypothetical protein